MTSLKKVLAFANSWRNRYVSVYGKVCVVKTLILSKLTCIATVLPTLAGSAGTMDNAFPPGDPSMEVEDEVWSMLQSSCSGDGSAPGDVPLKDKRQSFDWFAPPSSDKGQEINNSVKISVRSKTLATVACNEDQP